MWERDAAATSEAAEAAMIEASRKPIGALGTHRERSFFSPFFKWRMIELGEKKKGRKPEMRTIFEPQFA